MGCIGVLARIHHAVVFVWSTHWGGLKANFPGGVITLWRPFQQCHSRRCLKNTLWTGWERECVTFNDRCCLLLPMMALETAAKRWHVTHVFLMLSTNRISHQGRGFCQRAE